MRKSIKIIIFLLLIFLIENLFYANINCTYADWAKPAENFINSADTNIRFTPSNLNEASSEIYNTLSSVGMIIAMVVGLILGIKYMMTSPGEKAQVMETILPYVIGCIIIFGAFGIWKILINTFYFT